MSLTNRESQPKSTYLVTYSQADPEKVGTREEFAQMVVDAFNKGCQFERVLHWACCKEKHKDGGHHYHLALKLRGVYRWKKIKFAIQFRYKISVNFTSFTTGYYDAYKYVLKEDKNCIVSADHPDFSSSPITKRALEARHNNLGEPSEAPTSSKRPRRRLTLSDLHDVVIGNNIKSDKELCKLANQQKKDGNDALSNFVLAKEEKKRNSFIATAWKMVNAEQELERDNKSRLDLLAEAKSSVDECGGRWLELARETLAKNNINETDFASSVFKLLEKGRGKHRNIMLVGKSNCAKTFMLLPLKKIYRCFTTPTKGTFNWVGAEKSECVLLNDFRWCEKVIPWSDFLNLLEGEEIHIQVPKTHFSEDPVWSADTPIFATSKSKIRKYEGGEIDEVETEMMETRWKVFLFKQQYSKEDVVEVMPCKKCFAELISPST